MNGGATFQTVSDWALRVSAAGGLHAPASAAAVSARRAFFDFADDLAPEAGASPDGGVSGGGAPAGGSAGGSAEGSAAGSAAARFLRPLAAGAFLSYRTPVGGIAVSVKKVAARNPHAAHRVGSPRRKSG
jgi:hypothetical protein